MVGGINQEVKLSGREKVKGVRRVERKGIGRVWVGRDGEGRREQFDNFFIFPALF